MASRYSHKIILWSFFITSAGPGNGADLGGLEGADQHCQMLADAVGAGDSQWRAYLSTISADGKAAVHARDRIGTRPWYNQKGVKVADNADDLHSDNANLTKQTILTEQGNMVNGRGDSPNMHDILTGSRLDGTAYTGEGYTNCDNWDRQRRGHRARRPSRSHRRRRERQVVEFRTWLARLQSGEPARHGG